jgi:DNA invertase Pin-like site-specific DNA recombinase
VGKELNAPFSEAFTSAHNLGTRRQTPIQTPTTRVAEFERAMIRERATGGDREAKQAGKYRGGQSTMTPAQVKAIRDRVAGVNKSALAREFGVTRQTIYNLLAA